MNVISDSDALVTEAKLYPEWLVSYFCMYVNYWDTAEYVWLCCN